MDWFTADLHIGHKNIIELSNRPFRDTDHMADEIRERWNSVVSREDTVYILGDFIWGMPQEECVPYIESLHGRKVLIEGNHDKGTVKRAWFRGLFGDIRDMQIIRPEDKHIHLCHYPLRTWYLRQHSSWHLHGHSHGNIFHPWWDFALDVGVDCNSYLDSHQPYTPYSLTEITTIMNRKRKHHMRLRNNQLYWYWRKVMKAGYTYWGSDMHEG
jgi:calcineurin-like phosphoesterase family protein